MTDSLIPNITTSPDVSGGGSYVPVLPASKGSGKKVWVVLEEWEQASVLLGVFSTRRKAQKYAKACGELVWVQVEHLDRHPAVVRNR